MKALNGIYAVCRLDMNEPEETVIISYETRYGKLNGNGNGMDFFACTLIKSDLSLNELKQYYSKTHLIKMR